MHQVLKREPFWKRSQLLTTLSKTPFQNMMEKRENAGRCNFLIFLPCFWPVCRAVTKCDLIPLPVLWQKLVSCTQTIPLSYPRKTNVFGDLLESACLSVHPCVCVSVCVQDSSFCQSAGRGIKSHLVTALLWFRIIFHLEMLSVLNC